LYFALEDYIYEEIEAQDACVWILEPHLMNKLEGFENVTLSIDSPWCRSMLKPAFDHRGEENDRVMAVMAAERDVRMFVQQGCFTIHSCRDPLNKRAGCGKYLSALRIPAERISEMAFAVDVCGFRKGDVFPDLDHLASEFKGRFRPE
jgi:hypothetical protein